MEHRQLGNSGLKVSCLALGCMTFGNPQWKPWILDQQESTKIIHGAIDAGVNFFDTADIYSFGESEKILGRALKEKLPREDAVIATKAGLPLSASPNNQGLSRKHLYHSIENSLRNLNTDYIDLFILHRWDYSTPLEETLATLADLVSSGKVRYLGVSSMWAWQLSKIHMLGNSLHGLQFISMQNHYNLVYREEEREVIPFCEEHNLSITPFSPLARGYLTRKPSDNSTKRGQTDEFTMGLYDSPENRKIVETVLELAQQHNCSAAEVCLAWMLKKKTVASIIIGANKLRHIEDSVNALDIHLSATEIETLESGYKPQAIIGHN